MKKLMIAGNTGAVTNAWGDGPWPLTPANKKGYKIIQGRHYEILTQFGKTFSLIPIGKHRLKDYI